MICPRSPSYWDTIQTDKRIVRLAANGHTNASIAELMTARVATTTEGTIRNRETAISPPDPTAARASAPCGCLRRVQPHGGQSAAGLRDPVGLSGQKKAGNCLMLLAYPPCPPSKEPAQTKGWFLFFSKASAGRFMGKAGPLHFRNQRKKGSVYAFVSD